MIRARWIRLSSRSTKIGTTAVTATTHPNQRKPAAGGVPHFAGNGESVGHSPGRQIGNRHLADGRAHAGELVEQRFTGGHHIRRGVTKPGPKDAEGQPAQVQIVPAQECRGQLLLADGIVRVRPGYEGVGQRRVGHAGCQPADGERR